MSEASKILSDINELQEKLKNSYLKNITIMFTDLKDSTKYFEEHGDIKGRLLIEKHNQILFPIIEKHSGRIIKTIGDAIMAVFEDEYLALRASVEMQKTLDEYNLKADDKIRIRIGIHTGKAIVEENDVFGDAVNVAARIESETPPSRITVSKNTLNALKNKHEIKLRPLGKVKFKGKSDEIEIYSVLWRTTKLKDLNIKKENKEKFQPSNIRKTEKKSKKNKYKKIYFLIPIILISVLLLIYFLNENTEQVLKKQKNENLSSDRKKIRDYAVSFIGKRIPKSKKWPNSLSGFVKMVYLNFDVDLTDVTDLKRKDGSWKTTAELIYSFVKENGKLYKKSLPKAGDFIFFDNTYDRNQNFKQDDIVTTVGLVIKTDEEGTVYFLYKVGHTIRVRNMNLRFPDKKNVKNNNIIKIYNSQIRKLTPKERKSKVPALASELFNSYGTILEVDKNGKKTKLDDFKFFRNLSEEKRKEVVDYALSFKGKTMPSNPKWGNSSSGFVKMVFANFRVNLTATQKLKDRKGKWYSLARLIYNYTRENGKIYENCNCKIGDFIFFNNTYDKNKDGKLNDRFTSTGLITAIEDDGRITFLMNISGTIVEKYLSLKVKESKRENRVLNSVLRLFKGKKLYSYDLVNSFGSVFK